MLQLEDEIQTRVQSEVDRSQREFYLREQMKAIQTELGEGDIWSRELVDLKEKIIKTALPDEARTTAMKEVERLAQMPPMAPEVGIIRTYLDWILELPWENETEDNLDVTNAARRTGTTSLRSGKGQRPHFGIYCCAQPETKTSPPADPVFCWPSRDREDFIGAVDCGSLGRKFVRLSLGGVRDEAEIRGHRRTYIGALPGRILQTMRKAGTINPLFMLDEIDKLGADFRGDPGAALLEVLDPEQNFSFSDHYLELSYRPVESHVHHNRQFSDEHSSSFIGPDGSVEFPGYIEEEKLEIARRFLIPRQMEEVGHGATRGPISGCDVQQNHPRIYL